MSLALIDHWHLSVTLYISMLAFQTEGKVYLILDFLRGGDLFTRLSKEVSNIHVHAILCKPL